MRKCDELSAFANSAGGWTIIAHRTLLAIAAGVGATMFSSPALATILPVIGGPGGSPFELRCADNEYLVGVRANAGAWIDGLGILCVTSESVPPRQVGWVGGRGGMDQEAYCPRGGHSNGIVVNFTRAKGKPKQYLNAIQFKCDNGKSTCISSGQGCDWDNHEPTFWSYYWSELGHSCPNDEILVGLVGKSERYVDAVGAICGRPTATATATPAPAYSPNTDRPSSFGSGPRSTQAISSSAGQSILPQVGQCRSGYVWREAGPGDLICVTPKARERARLENDLAASRIDPNSAYGPHGCRSGFVWREGFPGDLACVPPQSRADAAEENAAHYQNRD